MSENVWGSCQRNGGVIHTFFIICIAYFIIPIDIVGYKSYNPIMFVGIIGFII